MRFAGPLVLSVAIALFLGLWSAWIAVRSPTSIDAIESGAWRAWPNAGTADVDPYTRAQLARTGEVALGSGEGLKLLARTDDGGAPLTTSCDYMITGQTPPARLWTVVAEDDHGRPLLNQDRPAALGSDSLLRQSDGTFEVALSPATRPGNWVPTTGPQHFRVVLRLYDTTARTGTALTGLAMPKVTRGRCR